MGTASVILGTRHPLVVARAAVGAQVQSGGRFVLGVGTGGKPAMAQALGVDDRPVSALARECQTIHHALRGVVDPGLHFSLPPGYRPPPVWLASDDLAKWSALGVFVDGWMTFLTTPEDFVDHLVRVSTLTTSPPVVGVRLDVRLLADSDAPLRLMEPVRGVVTGSRRQLDRLAQRWHDLPVDHLILGIRGRPPAETVQAVREAWRLSAPGRTGLAAV